MNNLNEELKLTKGKRTKTLFSKKKVLIFVLVIAAGIAGFFAVRGIVNGASAKDGLDLRTSVAIKGNLSVAVTGSGPAQSSSKKSVTASVNGTLLESYKNEGDEVKAGDLLFELDDSTYKTNARQIELNLSQAKLDYENVQQEIDNLTMIAPFSGRVTSLSIKEGDSVSANTVVLTLIDESKLKITLPFTENAVKNIKIGDDALLFLADTMETFHGTVTNIDKNAYLYTDGSIVCDIEITADNPGLLHENLTATAKINTVNAGEDEIFSLGSGILTYINKTPLKAETSGTVKELPVEEGQFIENGEIIAIFQNEGLLLTKESNLIKVNNLELQLEEALKEVENCKIYAPIDGLITNLKELKKGDQIKTNDVLCSIINLNNIVFEISVDELDIPMIEVGQNVNVTVDAITESSGESFSGVVKTIAAQGTTQGGVTTYPVVIQINEPEGIKEGMNCNASIYIVEKNNVLLIPVEAVTNIGGRSMVFVKSGGQSQYINMQEGFIPGETIENIEGSSSDRTNRKGMRGGVPQGTQENSENSEESTEESNESSVMSKESPTLSVWNNDDTAKTTNENTPPDFNQSSAERLQSADNSETTTMIESFLKRNAVQDSRIIEYYKDAIPVFIETGVNNETYIEVVSGLQEGDVVILPPILKTANSNSSDNSDSANFMNGFGGMGGGSVAVPEDRGTRSDFQMPSNFNQNSAAPSARQN